MSIPEGYMQNAKGDLVAIANIKEQDLDEDALVKEIAAAADDLNTRLAAFRRCALDDVGAFVELLGEKYGVRRGGKKGNVTLTSFDGRLRVRVAIGEHIAFGAELTVAKQLIDQCIERWSDGANANLKALVDDAFQINKVGKIDTSRVLGLRRLEMGADADWARAMDAISDAVKVTGSKTYVRVYRVDPKTGGETPIALDLANV